MKLSPKNQQGMTMISMIFIGIVVGSIFFLAVTVVPIYMDHGKITGAMESLKETAEAGGGEEDSAALLSRLFKLLSVNNADSLIAREDVAISREDTGQTKVHIQYEVVKKLVGNASILVQFDDTVNIKGK